MCVDNKTLCYLLLPGGGGSRNSEIIIIIVVIIITIIIIIIIIIYCNWIVTRWQWLFYIYTKYEIGYY